MMADAGHPSLAEIDAGAWRALDEAAADPHSGFRYLTLCTVEAGHLPQARMVVLRRADRAGRRLEFHTDIRSPKWAQLGANPAAAVLGFCPNTRLQLRFQGRITRYPPGSALAAGAWAGLPGRTRATYAGGPPGDELAFGPATAPETGPLPDSAEDRFGVLVFQAAALDWFELRRADNRRAVFRYGESGALVAQAAVAP